MKKRFALLALLLVTVLLTGCLAPKVNFTIKPDPIVLTVHDDKLDGVTLEVKLSGFSFGYTVEKALVELFDEDGEEVFTDSKDINKKFPVVAGIKQEIEVPAVSLASFYEGIDPNFTKEVYESELLGKTYKLRITLTGKNPTSNTAKVEFE